MMRKTALGVRFFKKCAGSYLILCADREVGHLTADKSGWSTNLLSDRFSTFQEAKKKVEHFFLENPDKLVK